MAIRRNHYRSYGLLVSTHLQSSKHYYKSVNLLISIIQDSDFHNYNNFFLKLLSTAV